MKKILKEYKVENIQYLTKVDNLGYEKSLT